MEAWLGGNGCVPINHLMEDAATAEIARAQVWQWIRHPKGVLEDGRRVTGQLYETMLEEELDRIRGEVGAQRYESGNYSLASQLLSGITMNDQFEEFLTTVAYEHLD